MNENINECIIKCKTMFGFNKNYVLKLINARANNNTLKSRELAAKDILTFSENTEALYGSDLQAIMNTVLIERKTLKQQMLNNISSLKTLDKYFLLASDHIDKIKITKTKFDNEKAIIRLSGIGKIA